MRLIAAGGFGAVWRAQQKALDRPVAIKTLHAELAGTPEAVRRFEDEARLTASIHHEGVVTLLDHGVTDEVPWMAFELVDGPSLRSWVEGGPQPWPRVAEMARQVALALEEARRCGVVHRDVKPDNILQAGENLFKVADFGVAKWAGASVQTQDGMILGTPAYISPVQVRGLAPDHQSDLYALGVTMYELLTGRLPFHHDNPLILLERHIHEPAPHPVALVPDLPLTLDRIVTKLLAKDREDRFTTGLELAQELEVLLKGVAPSATKAVVATAVSGSGARAAGRAPRSRGAAGGAFQEHAIHLAALAVVVAIVGARLTRPAPPPTASPASIATPSAAALTLDGAQVDAAHYEALRLHSELSQLYDLAPAHEDTFLGAGPNGLPLGRLQRAASEFLRLASDCIAAVGPGTEPLLQIERTGDELAFVADVYTEKVQLDRMGQQRPPEWLETETTLRRLHALIVENRGRPLGRLLDTTVAPQLASIAIAHKGWRAELVGPSNSAAARMVEELFPRSRDLHVLFERIDLLDRATHAWLVRRQRQNSTWSAEVAPSEREERAAREAMVDLVPQALGVIVADPLLRGHLLQMYEQLIVGAGYLMLDPLAPLPARQAACRAMESVLLFLRASGWRYDSLYAHALTSVPMLRAGADRVDVRLDVARLAAAEAYFLSLKPGVGLRRPWPLDLPKRRP